MDRGRRRLLCCVAVGLGGCIRDPGRDCPGATYRLRLSPADDAADPLSLPPGDLSAAGNAVVEAAIADAHVETCVDWDGTPGPSDGLREVGERIEAHTGVALADRTEDVTLEVEVHGGAIEYDGEPACIGILRNGDEGLGPGRS